MYLFVKQGDCIEYSDQTPISEPSKGEEEQTALLGNTAQDPEIVRFTENGIKQ